MKILTVILTILIDKIIEAYMASKQKKEAMKFHVKQIIEKNRLKRKKLKDAKDYDEVNEAVKDLRDI